MRVSRYRYLLGDSSAEASRLRAQARLWDPFSHALFDRLGVRRGWKVLEIGPGQGSLHLELRRRVRGPVDAVERSAAFADRLEKLCAKDRRGLGRLWRCDLIDADLPNAHYDLIFARWVFLFLPEPLAHIKKLAAALKPGGRLALVDYHRKTEALIPTPPEWDDFVEADLAFFRSQGGDASIASRLPVLYAKAGLQTTEIVPEIKLGRPGSEVWEWVTRYFLGVLDRLAAFRPLTPAKARRLRRAWIAAGRRKETLFIAPAVVSVVGRRSLRT